jgi:hypothetical protein
MNLGRWLVVAALAMLVGCSGVRTAGSLDRFGSQLDRVERARRLSTRSVRAESRFPTARRDSSKATFRLASDTGSQRAGPEEGAGSFGLSPAATDDWAAGVESQETTRPAQGRTRPGPLPGLWDTIKRDVRSMPGDLWDDTKKVYTSAPNLLILGLAYGGNLAVQESGVDGTVEDHLHNHDIFSGGVNDTFGALGNPGTHFALAGAWYLIGQQTQNEKTYEVGKTLFSALIINGVSTMAGQVATWDDGPNGEWGSFPSGHTSSTFCFASVMHEAYGPLVGVPLYGLGALVAIERLDDDEHYLSDVLMGAVLGTVIGHTVAGEHELKLFGGEILPYADPNTGSTGVAWVRHFK